MQVVYQCVLWRDVYIAESIMTCPPPAMKIHLSMAAEAALRAIGGYQVSERGQMEIKVCHPPETAP